MRSNEDYNIVSITPRELKLMLAKETLKSARKGKRPVRGAITDKEIEFLKSALNAPDVNMFLRLV